MTLDAPAASPAPPRRRRRAARLILVALLVAAGALGSAAGYAAWAMGGSATGEQVRIIVPEGATGADIARLLAEGDVVRSAFMFRLVARFRGVATDLKPGAYELRTGLGVSGAIDRLREGVPIEVERFTIPEGKTVQEIASIIGRDTHLTRRGFLRAVDSGTHRIAIMPAKVHSLEGLLFPKTYEITVDATAGEVVDLMLTQFEKETTGIGFSAARALGVTPYEAVIVASLIEREARLQREQRVISSVIYNRLRRPMRLQIDATVQYAIFLATGSYKYPLTFDDYEFDSPYNTYQIDGLPPTPIAAPGLGALRAALDPANTDYYFYRVVNDRGEHCFSKDEAGHAACGRRAS